MDLPQVVDQGEWAIRGRLHRLVSRIAEGITRGQALEIYREALGAALTRTAPGALDTLLDMTNGSVQLLLSMGALSGDDFILDVLLAHPDNITGTFLTHIFADAPAKVIIRFFDHRLGLPQMGTIGRDARNELSWHIRRRGPIWWQRLIPDPSRRAIPMLNQYHRAMVKGQARLMGSLRKALGRNMSRYVEAAL